MAPEIAGVILAGGRSQRMGGGDKVLRPLGGRPMIAHVIDKLSRQVQRIAINANGDPARFAAFGLPVIADGAAGSRGPLSGILAGMRWGAEIGADHVVTVAGDTPFFPADLVARFRRALTGAPGTIVLAACADELHQVSGLWPVDLADDLAAFLQDANRTRITDWAADRGFVTCDFPVRHADGREFRPFFNVNTPEQLAEAEALFEEAAR